MLDETLGQSTHPMFLVLKAKIKERIVSRSVRIILAAALQNKRSLLVVFVTSLFAALFEGSTFGILMAALGVLSDENTSPLNGALSEYFSGLGGKLQDLTSAELFFSLIGVAVTLQILRSGLTYLGLLESSRLASDVQARIQNTVYHQIMSFSFACASRHKAGDLADYTTTPAMYVNNFVTHLNIIFVSLLTSVAYVAVLTSLSWRLMIGSVFLFGPAVVIQRHLIGKIRQVSMRLSRIRASLSERTVESLNAIRLIHTYAQQRETVDKMRTIMTDNVFFARRQHLLQAFIIPVSETMTFVALGVFMALAYHFFLGKDGFALSAMLTFITVFYRLANKAQLASAHWGQLAACLGPINRLDGILATSDKQFERKDGVEFDGLQREIRFDHVGFRYGSDRQMALENVSFTMAKGTVTALVGASGSGKSTIADLLIGLYDPDHGCIFVDKMDLRGLSLGSWRRRLGVVSQDTLLFNDTISANIAYGTPSATEAQIIAAAEAAQANTFINALPQGYETVVGERGLSLSGGQRQRIALARAILRDPVLLILDEATSALDTESEKLVQQALALFQKDRTVLVIAHRLSTIVDADQIVVMEKGRIIETGAHADLLRLNKSYARYWQLQSANFEG